jgi:mutator protein MutT
MPKEQKIKQIVVGIIEREGKILIVQRKEKEKGTDGSVLTWVFPGGSVENESKEEAVQREVLEETGCQVKVRKLISSRMHPQFPVEIFYYACQLLNVNQKSISEEINQVKWIEPEELTS